MKEDLQIAIKKVMPVLLKGAAEARALNAVVPVSGERHTLALDGRQINMVYYRAKSDHAPLFIGLHGGGFLFGGSAMDDELWVQVSSQLDVNIASVDYRMSPEVMDYACLYDAYDSTVYLKDHAEEFGFDPDQISTFGSSAGGNLAAAVALLAKQRGDLVLRNQILMYPFLDGDTDPGSKGEGSFTGLPPYIMNQLHFSPDKSRDPLLSPAFATKEMLEGLPRAIVVYCENDNLRPEAVQYCRNLEAAGVEVAEMLAEKMPHGFIETGFKDHFSEIELNMLGENSDDLIQSGLLRNTSIAALEFVGQNMLR